MKRIFLIVLVAMSCLSLASCENDGPSVYTRGYNLSGSYNAVLSGRVSNDGTKTITEVGFLYSETTSSPTYSDGYKKVCGRTEGEFSATVPRSPNYTLYFRAYAKTSSGSVYYGGVLSIYKDY